MTLGFNRSTLVQVILLASAFLSGATQTACSAGSGLALASNQQLEIVTDQLAVAEIGVPYSQTLEAVGGTGSSYTWSLDGGLMPDGLALDAGGVIAGTPTTTEEMGFSVQVTDGLGRTALKALTISVVPKRSNLTIINSTLPDGTAGVDYTVSLQTRGGAADSSYTWTLTDISPGIQTDTVINAATETSATLSTVLRTVGDFSITVEVTDSTGAVATQTFSMAVQAAGSPLELATVSIADTAVNQSFDRLINAVGGQGNYTWSLVSGQLPDGVDPMPSAGSPAAFLSGQPVAEGLYTFTVEVTDSAGATADQTYSLYVHPELKITTLFLPDGFVNSNYAEFIDAEGGTGTNYTWSIIDGLLPDSFQFSDSGTPATAIFGTPAENGAYQFTFQVEDDAGNVAVQMLGLIVPESAIWMPTSQSNAPSSRYAHTAIWTGETGNSETSNRMLIWGGAYGAGQTTNTGGLYDPLANQWEDLPNLNSGTGAPEGRWYHTAVWTGDTGDTTSEYRMIVWGGAVSSGSDPSGVTRNTGGAYNPDTDQWESLPNLNDGIAEILPRFIHLAVWTGNTGDSDTEHRMIIWGGTGGGTSGASYHLATDTWTLIADAAATLGARGQLGQQHIWTGDTGNPDTEHRLVVWGDSDLIIEYNDGAIYNPADDSWTAIPADDAPIIGRSAFSRVWDDVNHRMIVWGGYIGASSGQSTDNLGGVYDPATQAWLDTPRLSSGVNAPFARNSHTGVWTGSAMIVWGGESEPAGLFGAIESVYYNSGGIYNPAIDSWTHMPTSTAPAGRSNHTAIWTGTQMIVWGGSSDSSLFNSGGIYTP